MQTKKDVPLTQRTVDVWKGLKENVYNKTQYRLIAQQLAIRCYHINMRNYPICEYFSGQ